MSIKTTIFRTDPKAIAPLLLRLLLGAVFIAHGSQKLFGAWGGSGLEGFANSLTSMGMTPGMFWAVVTALTEFLGGILLVAGLLTRVSAALIGITMIVAIWKVHMGSLFSMEFPLTLLVVALTLVGTGGGALSVDGKIEHKTP